MWNEPSIVAEETHDTSEFIDFLWCWTIQKLLYFIRVCAYTLFTDYLSEERNLLLEKVTLYSLEFEMSHPQSLENSMPMLQMLVHCLTENEDVIQVAETNLPL